MSPVVAREARASSVTAREAVVAREARASKVATMEARASPVALMRLRGSNGIGGGSGGFDDVRLWWLWGRRRRQETVAKWGDSEVGRRR